MSASMRSDRGMCRCRCRGQFVSWVCGACALGGISLCFQEVQSTLQCKLCKQSGSWNVVSIAKSTFQTVICEVFDMRVYVRACGALVKISQTVAFTLDL